MMECLKNETNPKLVNVRRFFDFPTFPRAERITNLKFAESLRYEKYQSHIESFLWIATRNRNSSRRGKVRKNPTLHFQMQ